MRNAIVSAGLSALVAYGIVFGLGSTGDRVSIAGADDIAGDFHARVHSYATLRDQIAKTTPTVAISNDWAAIMASVDALAERIQTARAGARRGDIFTPPIERWFRLTVSECEEGLDASSLNEEESTNVELVPSVNGRWPRGTPLPTMAPLLLERLPPLPRPLQYRFMNRALILWDSDANVIVDFIDGVQK
jgi:hypothetical protein